MDLAATAGLELDPWQAQVLAESLGERHDGQWAAFEVGLVVPRQNGKGSILEARELAGLFLFEEQLIIHSAHLFDTSLEAFQRILSLIEQTPSLLKRVRRVSHSHGEEGIELRNGCRLRFKARTKGGGRGFSGDLVILDEAYNLTADSMAALFPTLSARPNPQIWYTSSAGMESSDQLKRVRGRGMAGDSERLAYFEWSCEPSVSTTDREGWAKSNPALGYRISEEFIAAEQEAMPELEFARERLGVWHELGADTVIDLAVWAELEDPESAAVDPVVFAVDTTPDRSSAAIAVCGRRPDGLHHLEIVDHRSGTAWVPDRVAELYERWRPLAVALDPGSAAGSLLPALQEHSIEPYLTTSREIAQGCGAFYDAVCEQASVRYLGHPALHAAVAGAQKRPLEAAWAWKRKDMIVDICPLVAVTLAHHAFAVHEKTEYDVLASVW